MNEPEDLSLWIHRLKGGDEEAAAVVWDTCIERLKKLAKKKISKGPQRSADEEDIALSALHSFMKRARDGRFPDIDDRQSMWRMLFTITVRKSARHLRWLSAEKRPPEIGEAQLSTGEESRQLGLGDFASHEVPPDRLVEELDRRDAFNQTLEELDPELREIIVARLEGYSTKEIADQRKCSTRTIERKLQLIRKTWESDFD